MSKCNYKVNDLKKLVTRFGQVYVRGAMPMMESDSLIQNKEHPVWYAKDYIITLPLLSTLFLLHHLEHKIPLCPSSLRFYKDLSRNKFSKILSNSSHKNTK